MRAFTVGVMLIFFATSVVAEDLHFSYWNVENLFDTEDDPAVDGDEEFTPRGEKKWNDEKLKQKTKNLTRVITAMNSQRGTDLLGLGEIENLHAVEMVVKELATLNRQYKIIHHDSPSGRGIDCAIIYDGAKFNLLDAQFHQVLETTKPTREIVEAKLSTSSGSVIHVFANHWPSRANPESDRLKAAETLRKRIDVILNTDPAADLIIMGDLNDFPDNKSVKEALNTTEHLHDATGNVLFNTMWPLFRTQDKGSYVYKNKWQVLDQIIVSPGMLDRHAFAWKPDSSESVIVTKDQLFDPDGEAIPRPNRTYSGNAYHKSGYSDHLPVQAIIQSY
jgi:predicted extracellular nuclease